MFVHSEQFGQTYPLIFSIIPTETHTLSKLSTVINGGEGEGAGRKGRERRGSLLNCISIKNGLLSLKNFFEVNNFFFSLKYLSQKFLH